MVAHAPVDIGLIERLCEKPRLTATPLRDHLDAHAAPAERRGEQMAAMAMAPPERAGAAALARYAGIGTAHREVAR